MNDKAEKIALFRYGLIAPLVLETLPRGELTRRAQEIAARLYDIPHSRRRQVSVDTLLEWALLYRRNGLAGYTPNHVKTAANCAPSPMRPPRSSKGSNAKIPRAPARPC